MKVIYQRNQNLEMKKLEEYYRETKEDKRKIIFSFIGFFLFLFLLMLWLECYYMLIMPILFIGLFLWLYFLTIDDLENYYDSKKNAILKTEHDYLDCFYKYKNNQILEYGKDETTNSTNIKYEENGRILQKTFVFDSKETRTDIDEDTILINDKGVTYLEKYIPKQ